MRMDGRGVLRGMNGGRGLKLLDVVGVFKGSGFGAHPSPVGYSGMRNGLRSANLGEVCRSSVLTDGWSFVMPTLMKGGFADE